MCSKFLYDYYEFYMREIIIIILYIYIKPFTFIKTTHFDNSCMHCGLGLHIRFYIKPTQLMLFKVITTYD